MKFFYSLKSQNQSFTLIELLIAIGILGILTTAVVVALNPAKQIADALDSRRTTDVQSILSAIQQYIIDNKGNYPTGLAADDVEKQLGTAASGCTISTGGCSVTTSSCLDLTTQLAKYLPSIPKDPKDGTDNMTKYSVVISSTTGIMTVKACSAQNTTISMSR